MFWKKVFKGDEASDQPKNLNNFFCNFKKKEKKRKTKSVFSTYNKFLLRTSDRLINGKLQGFLCNKNFKMEHIQVKFVMNKLYNNK